ncbi:ComF family protein [Enterococcus timonensis]|uniref:ComF family protein n=1 Tax=Enterococcus timonensis TaxID=1852364 RepID=UPI00131A09EF|nr:hypothetical protein [Enterococcus timonensis]
MEQFKFKGAYHYRFALTEMLAGKITIPKNHLLVPIPLSRQRYESRGFNQVTAVLESAKFAYTPLLNRKVDFTAQSFQKKKERMNLPQVFEVNEKFANSSQKIILIDDVYTTGTTLVRAQQACEGQNLKVVKTLSFAR